MKDSYKVRKQQIYEAFEPIRDAKRKTIQRIASLGKGKNGYRYLVLAFLIPFIFFYNLFIYMVMGFQMHKKLAKTIAVSMSMILAGFAACDAMTEEAYALEFGNVMVTTPDLGGKVVHAALYNGDIFLNYELDMICDGRTYEIYAGQKSVAGHSSNNYVFTTKDPSVNINEQYSFITQPKQLDFYEMQDAGYYNIVAGENLTESVTIQVQKASSSVVKYIKYTDINQSPPMQGGVEGTYTKTFTQLGIAGTDHNILGFTGTYYFNSNQEACGLAQVYLSGTGIVIDYHSHGANAGNYAWQYGGLWITYQDGTGNVETETITLAPGTKRAIYVRPGDELTISGPAGISISHPHEVITVEGNRECVVDIDSHEHAWTYELGENGNEIKAVCGNSGCPVVDAPTLTLDATDTTYTASPYAGLTVTDGIGPVTGATYELSYLEFDGAPINVGNYVVTATLGGITASDVFAIERAPLTITAKDQNIHKDGEITESVDMIEVEGLLGQDYVDSITLTPSTTNVTDNGVITPSNAVIISDNYVVEYNEGNLVIDQVAPVISELPLASEITYGQSLFNSTISGGVTSVPGIFTWNDITIKPSVSDSNVTQYAVTFTPNDSINYSSVEISLTVPVLPKEITEPMVSIDSETGEYIFTGIDITAQVIVKDGQYTLTGEDYAIYNNTKISCGEYTINIVGTGNYTGSVNISWKITDPNPPTGKIEIADNEWESFLDEVIFELFFGTSQNIIITAEDGINESGLDTIHYFLSEEQMTGSDLADLPEYQWIAIANGGSFEINPQIVTVVYARITDKAGNITYISSDGIVLDGKAPIITGVNDNTDYCESQTIQVTDDNLFDVTINDEAVELDEEGYYTILATGEYLTIVATDYAGNVTTVSNVRIFDGHSFTHYVGNNDESTEHNETETALCDRGCGATDTREIPDTMIVPGEGCLSTETNIDENVPKTSIENLNEELVKDMLDDVEYEAYNWGYDFKVILNVSRLDGITTPADDMDLIKALLAEKNKDNHIGVILDISMFKQRIYNGYIFDPVRITDTKGDMIELTTRIPQELINTKENVDRNYYIIRVHEGRAEILDSLFDADTESITFESDLFSTYVIAYEDMSKNPVEDNNEPPKDEPQDVPTGDLVDPKEWLIAILISLGIFIGQSIKILKKMLKTRQNST